jgi:hypothetical protein
MERCVCVGINNNFGASGGRGQARFGLALHHGTTPRSPGANQKTCPKQLCKPYYGTIRKIGFVFDTPFTRVVLYRLIHDHNTILHPSYLATFSTPLELSNQVPNSSNR